LWHAAGTYPCVDVTRCTNYSARWKQTLHP
jgi:hypothetical protein